MAATTRCTLSPIDLDRNASGWPAEIKAELSPQGLSGEVILALREGLLGSQTAPRQEELCLKP